ncbi:MAG: zinc dependent phospholipase C family protein [Chloroflexota bacterium]|nr:zinc dependent phospholipase C family protein [Chloroflexota bacterium]
MPGPIVHLIVERRYRPYLSGLGGVSGNKLAAIINADPCSPYLGFGSMGPDFLFFSVKEYGNELAGLVNGIFKVYDAFEPLREFFETYVDPIADQIEDAVAAVDNALFKGLFQQLGATANLLSTTALTAVANLAVQNVDPFYFVYPKVQKGAPETEWYWFDTLHYRRTGDFSSQLWKLAGADADLQRYALGYATHIATDVIGHPFVNTIVGGPFRMHWRRHHLVENWIDAYARRFYPDPKATRKCLNLGTEDHYLPDAISGSYYYRLVAFPGEKLPPKLKELFVQALKGVYSAVDHPPMLGPADVDAAYRLWLRFFIRATEIGGVLPPTPVPPPGGAAAALINSYVNSLPAFPGGGGPPGGGGFNLANIFAALFAFAEWLLDVIAATSNWIVNNAVAILQLLFNEALDFAKWLIYQIQKAVWEIYDNLRFELVLAGLLFPEPRDLDKAPWGLALLNTDFVQLTGGPAADFNKYPRKQVAHSSTTNLTHHLRYPTTPMEQPMAEPMPKPFHGMLPKAFISNIYPVNPVYDAVVAQLHSAKGPYPGIGAAPFTHEVDTNTWMKHQLGNALTFSAQLIAERLQQGKIPNFNLDGDRGYAWKTWRAEDPQHIEQNNPVPVKYTDP